MDYEVVYIYKKIIYLYKIIHTYISTQKSYTSNVNLVEYVLRGHKLSNLLSVPLLKIYSFNSNLGYFLANSTLIFCDFYP